MSDNTSLWTVIGLPLGLLSLIGYLYRRRQKVHVKNKVVLITGASSGLGEGKCDQKKKTVYNSSSE